MTEDLSWLADTLNGLPDGPVDRTMVEHLARDAWRAGVTRGKHDLLCESFVAELHRMQPRSGDLLVLRLPRDLRLTRRTADRLIAEFGRAVGSVCTNVRCIILEDGIAVEQVQQGARP